MLLPDGAMLQTCLISETAVDINLQGMQRFAQTCHLDTYGDGAHSRMTITFVVSAVLLEHLTNHNLDVPKATMAFDSSSCIWKL